MPLIVLGQSHLAIRLGGLVRRLGLDAAAAPLDPVSPPMEQAWRGRIVHPGAADEEGFLERIGVAEARAVLVCTASDERNLSLALRIRDFDPHVRLVISFFNPGLGEKIQRELGNCSVMSSAELSASGFAAAALHKGALFTVAHEGRLHTFVRADAGPPLPGDEVAPGIRFLPTEQLVGSRPLLQDIAIPGDPLSHPRRSVDRFLFWILGLIALLFAVSTAYFHFGQGMPWLAALYFVVTTFCTVGYGDYSLRDASDLAKVMGILLMLASVTLTAGLFAILTNALMEKRTNAIEGRRVYRLRGHVLLCGLGTLGHRVAACLRSLGAKGLVIEKNRQNPILDQLSARRIPYMVSDATRTQALLDANIKEARALICAVNDDLLGLEIGLVTRAIHPGMHVVLRVFDGELADRMERHFHIHTALSTSYLAAPFFLARALHPDALALLELDRRWLVLMEREPGAPPLEGQTPLAGGTRALVLCPLESMPDPQDPSEETAHA